MAALFHGQVINVAGLARDAATARTTIEGYLGILQDTLVATILPAFEAIVPFVTALLMLAWLPESLQFLAVRKQRLDKLARWLKQLDPTLRIDASTQFKASVLERLPLPKAMLPLSDAAGRAGLDPATLRQQIRNQRLVATKWRREWWVDERELEAYLERRAPQGRRSQRKRAVAGA